MSAKVHLKKDGSWVKGAGWFVNTDVQEAKNARHTMMSIIDFTQLEKVIEKMVSTYTAANSCDRFGDDKHCDICKKCKNVSFYTYSVKKDDMRHKSVCPLLLCESCENTLTNKLMLLYTETIANLIHEFQFHSKDKN